MKKSHLLPALLISSLTLTIVACGDKSTSSDNSEKGEKTEKAEKGKSSSNKYAKDEIVVTVDSNGKASGCKSFHALYDGERFIIDDIIYDVHKGELHVTRTNTPIEEANIISALNYKNVEYKVTEISHKAFHSIGMLTSVTIPTNVYSIGDGAFEGCMSLKTVKAGGVYNIGKRAFKDCFNLESITIFDTTHHCHIDDFAFYMCSNLRNVEIPSIHYIGEGAFKYCSSLESFTFPNALEVIEDSAFEGCSALKSIYFKGDVTSIGRDAFAHCTSLKDVWSYSVLPNGVTIFNETPIADATLHVPADNVEYHKNTRPWYSFGNIVAIQ